MKRFNAKTAIVNALIVLSMFASSTPVSASQTGSEWPMFLGDSRHSSYSSDSAISSANASTFGVKWMANLYNADLGSPVVAYNSTLGKTVVYVGNQRADVFAVDAATGKMIWSTNLGVNDKIQDTPMVAPDGTVWVGTSYNAHLYKLDGATGKVDCSIKAALPLNGSPMIATPAGGVQTVYWDYIDSNGAQGPTIATNESTCAQIFSFSGYRTHAGTWATPALGRTAGGEPVVLVGTADSDTTEYAIDANTGALVWDYAAANPPPSIYDIGDAATISDPGENGIADGVTYFDTKYGYEYAIDMTTGAPLWNFHIAAGTSASSSRSSAALDGTNLVFGYGQASGFGGSGGVYALNAVNGNVLWQYANPTEVLSSPAIIGPQGSEVVAFGDLTGAVKLLSLANGAQLYKGQTGGYITASPAEANGTVFISSSDGFLYAYGPGGSNAPAPSSAITYPSTESKVPNPNGNITISGTSSDSSGVNAVEIAVQENGTSGPWFNASNGTYNGAPVRNLATLASPGATSTSWSFSFPAPAAGGTFEVFANTVNTGNIVDHGTNTTFTIAPSKGEPNVNLSSSFVSPGASFTASSTAFKAGETVAFSMFGSTVATAVATSTGYVPKTTIKVPTTASFGPTSLTLTGQTSGTTTTATVSITNNWTQFGHDAGRSSYEPHDPVINASLSVGNGTILSQSWYYQSTAAVNSSPSIVDGVSYFGNDAGVVTALVTNTGAPKWTYTTPSKAAIQNAPAIDPSGNVIVGSTDGTLYTLNSGGALARSVSLGGSLTSPAVDNGQIFVSSSNGSLYDISDSTGSVTWTSALSGAGHSSPAYDSTKTLVIAGDDSGAVTAFNSTTGTQVWKATTGGAVTATPLIMNGTVFIGSHDGNLYALTESTGAQQWKYAATGAVVGGASMYTATQIAFGDANGQVFLLKTTGGLVQHIDSRTKSAVIGIASVENNMLVTMQNGLIGLIRIGGPMPFGWTYQTGSTLSSSPAIVDGTVYVGAADGGVYAFTPQGANPLSKTRGATITITDANGWSCSTTP